jgi:hypothetical protein
VWERRGDGEVLGCEQEWFHLRMPSDTLAGLKHAIV